MTQALQIPMLMLSSDTMLKPDSSAASGDTSSYESSQSGADEAAAFGQLLSDMVEPGKNGKASVGQRQIPAGVASLSSLSAALRHSETAEPADDSLLANNLLQQIALGWQSETKNNKEQANETEVDSDAMSSEAALTLAQQTLSVDTDGSKTAAELLLEGEPETSELKAELAEAAKQQADSSGKDATAKTLAQQTLSEFTDGGKTAAAISVSAATLSAAGTTQLTEEDGTVIKTQLSVEVAEATSDPEKTALAQVKAKTAALDDAASSQANNADVITSTLTEDDAVKTASAQVTEVAQAEDRLLTQSDKKPLAEQSSSKVTTGDKSVSAATDSVKETLVSDSEASTPADVTVQRAMTVTSASNAQANTARNTAESAGDSPQQKLQTVPQSGQSDNGAAAEGDSQQQNPAERLLSSELQNAFSRTGNDSSQTRTEQTFASTLQHIQQTTRSTDSSRPQLKTASEQLQQNLNLQQHDAAGQLRERVNLMVRQNIQIAEIRLDPAGLGQMQIKVDVQQDQTNVQFVVQQSQAKELIEQQLPRLREMLQQQGIVLGEGSVQQQSQQERHLAQGQQQQHGQTGSQQGDAADGMTADGATAQVKVAAPDRLVDYYA